MKKTVCKIALVLSLSMMALASSKAQGSCEMPMSVYLSNSVEIPNNSLNLLYNKLNRVISDNGIASDGVSQFVLSCNIMPMDKKILAGPPQSFVYEFDVNLFVGQTIERKIYASTSLTLKGVGSTETQAYNNAIQKIHPAAKEVKAFMSDAKLKITAFYNNNLDRILAQVKSDALKKEYESAFYSLSNIPECIEKYDEVIKLGNQIYKEYVDFEGCKLLQQAKMAWSRQQNSDGAIEASDYLSAISPDSKCYSQIDKLVKEIEAKTKEDIQFERKQYQDEVDLNKQMVSAWKEIGIAYGNNQPEKSTEIIWVK